MSNQTSGTIPYETLDDSETCSTIYIVQMHIHNGPPPPAAGACSGSEKILFFDLPYLSSQSMQIVLCKLSYTSENGGREPVPTLCECKPRPSTRLTTDESNLLIMLSLPPITDIASDAKYIDYGTIICCSFSRCKSGTVRACRGAFCPPQISLELTARSEIRIGCSVSIVTTKCTASLHPSSC